MSLRPGDVFQIKGFENHARVVVTFPDAEGKVVIFGLTDAKNLEDRVCLFHKGDHSFFRFETAVSYHRANVVSATSFQEENIRKFERLKPEQLLKVIELAFESEDIEPKFLALLPSRGSKAQDYVAKVYAQK